MFSLQKIHIVLIALLLSPTVANANDAARLAALSKSDFMAEFEVLFPQAMSAQKTLFMRFDPEMAEKVMDIGPISDEERLAMECSWDYMNARGQLEGLAHQAVMGLKIQELIDQDTEVDIVDFFLNSTIIEKMTAEIPKEALDAAAACGVNKASEHRLKLGPDVWAAFAAAGQKRGY